jgi:general secretion pathway protein E
MGALQTAFVPAQRRTPMSFGVQQRLRLVPSPIRMSDIPTPKDAGFAKVFGDLLERENLVDAAAISRARRAAEAASERLDFVVVKLGLMSEGDLCIAYAAYCHLPLVGPGDLPDRAILADRLKVAFLKTNRMLPVSFDG